jgi:hypothetical protein
MKAGVLPGRMFSFERYYAEDRPAYYAALRSVRANTFNMEAWLEYFLKGLAEEYERVAAAVLDLSSLAPGGGVPLRLRPSQQQALTQLRIQGRREFTRREYEEAARVGRSSAGEDLAALVSHGILAIRGAGPSTRYVFPTAGASPGAGRRGRPAKWTDIAIERELRVFLAAKSEWPPAAEFRAAGKGALYQAMARAGGVARWRRMLGL